MKIKLQDHSVISNKWIDEEIKKYSDRYDKSPNFNDSTILVTLNKVKQQLIPSEKLANVYFDFGTLYMWQDVTEPNFKRREDFLNSEIEIQ